MELSEKLDYVAQYNNLRDIRQYLTGLVQNLGGDTKLKDVIGHINYKMLVIEKQISNNKQEQ